MPNRRTEDLPQSPSVREIAEQLIITENTARNHVSRILEKLGLSRCTEAATFAAQHGLLKDECQKRVMASETLL